MTLDPKCVGAKTQVHRLAYDWKTLSLYALGIGATRDELDYVYEARGPKVFPSFAVVPSYPVLSELLELTRGPFEMVIHGGQTVRMLGELPPSGVLETEGVIEAVYDLKLLAMAVFRSVSTYQGKPIFENEWQILYRGEGGFGGPRRPKSDVPNAPKRAPDWTWEQTIGPEQALLYRLSGDYNPLHADPELAAKVGFERGPILHGLATFGYLCRAVTQKCCDGDASRLRSLTAQFKKPVWPGEVLRADGFNEAGRVILQAYAGDRSEAVVTGCVAEFA
jgi:acyl dehydratase